MKRLLLLFSFCCVYCLQGKGQRIAIINTDSVLHTMEAYHHINDLIKQQTQEKDIVFDNLSKDFIRLYERGIEQTQRCISPLRQRELEDSLMKKQNFLMIYQEICKEGNDNYKKGLNAIVLDVVKQQVRIIAKQQGFNSVLEADSLYYFSPEYDITSIVIQQVSDRKIEDKIKDFHLTFRKKEKNYLREARKREKYRRKRKKCHGVLNNYTEKLVRNGLGRLHLTR